MVIADGQGRSQISYESDRSFCIMYLFPPELHISLSDFSAGDPPSRCLSRDQIEKSRAFNVKIGAGAGRRLMRGGSANAARGALGAMPPWVPRGISTVSLRYLYGIYHSVWNQGMRIAGYKSPAPAPLGKSLSLESRFGIRV